MKKIFFVLIAAFLLTSCSAKVANVVVKNTLDFDRKGEIVEVKIADLKADFNKKSYVLKNASGEEVGYQLSKANGTESLIFQADVPAQSSVTYSLTPGTPSPVAIKTTARFVPERSDDFAFENDFAAYRMYGPALEKIENPSNGIDIWMKYKDEPVMDKIYDGRLSKPALSYHEDNGLGGFDSYDVKYTLGAGGVAPVTSQWWLGETFDRYEIIEKGPLRSVFQLIYDTIHVENGTYQEILTITTEAGSPLNKAVVSFKGIDQPMKLVTGIFMHGDSVNTVYDRKHKILSYTKNVVTNKGVAKGQTYIGIYTPDAVGEAFVQDKTFAILNDYKAGDDLTYYFGGTWNGWKVPAEADWISNLVHFSQAKQNPLVIEIH
ncbi:MAG: DUF4861 family protein [Candidatus Symbiothrix sp.]|nr:DUF4861 family protein [Candidatus Symbiothrix sp.]